MDDKKVAMEAGVSLNAKPKFGLREEVCCDKFTLVLTKILCHNVDVYIFIGEVI